LRSVRHLIYRTGFGRWWSNNSGYKKSRQSSQFYGPPHVASAMEMANAGENSPFFLEPTCEIELEALCTDERTIVLNMGARTNPNCSSNIVLQSKGVLAEASAMQRRAGS
jgi:hypothetical protein